MEIPHHGYSAVSVRQKNRALDINLYNLQKNIDIIQEKIQKKQKRNITSRRRYLTCNMSVKATTGIIPLGYD
jgi:hypothetical protein